MIKSFHRTPFIVLAGVIAFALHWTFEYRQTQQYEQSKDHIKLQILHINDLHANYYPTHFWGQNHKISPLALIKGFVQSKQNKYQNSLFVSAGDAMEKGSVVEYLSGGRSTIEIYEQLGLDLLTLGNHDFAYGLDTSAEFSNRGAKQTLSANLQFPPQTKSATQAYKIFDVQGVKIGFLGLTAAPYNSKNHSFPGPYYEGMSYDYNFEAITKKTIAQLKSEGADIIILLSHIGIKLDRQLAKSLNGEIPLIIGGHSHTTLRGLEKTNGVYIAQAGRYASHVGEIVLYINKQTKNLDHIKYELHPVHPAIMPVDLHFNQFIENTLKWHTADWDDVLCRQTESLQPKDLAKIMGEALINTNKADWVMIDSNLFWQDGPKGPISLQDIFSVVPTEIQKPGTTGYSGLYSVELTGEEIEQIKKAHVRDTLNYIGSKNLNAQQFYRVFTHKKYALNLDYYYKIKRPVPAQQEVQMFELYQAMCQEHIQPYFESAKHHH